MTDKNEPTEESTEKSVVGKITRKDKPGIPICACGHPEETHGAGEEHGAEEAECVLILPGSPTGWLCGCEDFREVVQVSSLFPFKRATYGLGLQHTLLAGMKQLALAGGAFSWTDHKLPSCEAPDCGTVELSPPFPVRLNGKHGGGIGATKMLCRGCFNKFKQGELKFDGDPTDSGDPGDTEQN